MVEHQSVEQPLGPAELFDRRVGPALLVADGAQRVVRGGQVELEVGIGDVVVPVVGLEPASRDLGIDGDQLLLQDDRLLVLPARLIQVADLAFEIAAVVVASR